MSISDAAQRPAPSARREPRWALTRWVGWLLLACFAALVVTVVVVGERPGSYDDLRFAVERGDVDTVSVTGGLEAPYRGAVSVQVHWRDGLFRRVADVVEVHPAPRVPITSSGTPRVASVEDDLASIDRRVEVTRDRDRDGGAEVRGWQIPRWAGWLSVVVSIGTFALIVAGPPPWRANRWAWFWGLAFAAPVAIPAYLLLGGPTWLRPPPVDAPRVTGGWGFMAALLASLVIGALGAAFAV